MLAILVAFCAAAPLPAQETLQRFDGAVYVPDKGNDGDSFKAKLPDGREIRLRLYFVDCPESEAPDESTARRVREQRRFFGLPDADESRRAGAELTGADQLKQKGKEAGTFTAEVLARPFTVFTAFSSALGRTTGGRFYAFVTTAAGVDLGETLVRKGLARSFGNGRSGPEGASQNEQRSHLDDLQVAAMLSRQGVWAISDPDRIAQLRAEERKEETELNAEMDHKPALSTPPAAAPPAGTVLLDLNTATERQIETLPGVGAVLAGKIVNQRPYGSVDDLAGIRGMRPAILEKIRNLVTARPAPPGS